jgi:hypothetical protein
MIVKVYGGRTLGKENIELLNKIYDYEIANTSIVWLVICSWLFGTRYFRWRGRVIGRKYIKYMKWVKEVEEVKNRKS